MGKSTASNNNKARGKRKTIPMETYEDLLDKSQKYDKLVQDHATLQHDHATLEKNHAILENDHTTLGNEHIALEKHHTTLEQEYSTLDKDHATLRRENQKNKERVDDLIDTGRQKSESCANAFKLKNQALATITKLTKENAELKAKITGVQKKGGSKKGGSKTRSGRNGTASEESSDLQAQLTLATQENTQLKAEVSRLKANGGGGNDALKAELEDVIKRNTKLLEKLSVAYKIIRESGKVHPDELSANVSEAAKKYVKDVLFRTIILVNTKVETEVNQFLDMIYDGIKDERGFQDKDSEDALSKKEFRRIYKKQMLNYLSMQRQNVQTALLNACVGT
jgi:chromosome segregation ATPase